MPCASSTPLQSYLVHAQLGLQLQVSMATLRGHPSIVAGMRMTSPCHMCILFVLKIMNEEYKHVYAQPEWIAQVVITRVVPCKASFVRL